MQPSTPHDDRPPQAAEPVDISTARRNRQTRLASRHLTIADVCADLGISRSTFYEWRAKRKAPPCIKLPNGALRIRRDDYERWLSALTEEAA